ncbi:MAG: sugar phosphate nucleotidyltransferase [Chlamydiota bacterium]
MIHALILAGGGGTRLWPFSQEDRPKQFLTFSQDNQTLLQKTIQRLINSPLIQEIVVITQKKYQDLVEKDLSIFSKPVHILIEPCPKNTAPAIALGVQFFHDVLHVKQDEKILVLPSDHWISPENLWLDDVEQISQLTEETIVTFGAKPSRPETGFGYLRIGKKHKTTYVVEEFVEKPSLDKALFYCNQKNYFWNCGMFFFSIQTFWKELSLYAPFIQSLCEEGYESALKNFSLMPSISIDYAVMEKTKNISMYPLSVQWSDVGSWDGVYEILEKCPEGNVKIGNIVDVDTKNSLLISDHHFMCLAGLENILVVHTKEGLFISKKGESQKIKALMDMRKEKSPSISHSWGFYHLLQEDENFTLRKIVIHPDKKTDCFHNNSQFTLVKGSLKALEGTRSYSLQEKETFILADNQSCSFENTGKEEAMLIEMKFRKTPSSSLQKLTKLQQVSQKSHVH